TGTAGGSTIVIPRTVLVNGVAKDLTTYDLRGVRLEIVTDRTVVRTSIFSYTVVGSTLVLTVTGAWSNDATPQLGDVFRLTLDDAVRGEPSSIVQNSIYAENVNLGVL